ncbi:hypothetical protein JXQ70_05495, partial [bacterium]|nr:hypothetical protein [bacterium]
MDERNYIQGVSLLCLLVLFLGVVPMVGAFQEKEDLSQLDKLVMTIPEMRLPNESVKVEQMDDLIFQQDALFDFKSEYGDNWSMYVDIRRNVTSILKGGAIPFIPGKANKLTWEDFGATCSEAKCIPFEVIEDLTHDFLVEHKDLLGIIPSELVLRPENAVSVAHMVFVNYTQVVNGVPVEGATVNFRINRGNLLHVATEDYAPVKISTIPSISLETALDTVRGYLGEFSLQRDKIVDAGSLRLVPITPRGNNPDLFKGPVGTGYNHALAWRFVFVREGIVGQWEALVDAHSGELLRFVDINRYGMAHGYVYPGDNHNNEADRVFPFAHTNLAAPNDYTTEGGYFPGDSATIDLELGKFCRINDSCGSTALTTTTGDADFGLSLGTDCDVPSPNLGGPGNTWSSKVQFYHLTMINIKARTYYPTNTWLTTGYITCNVNQSAWCNATSSSGTLNFYQTAPPCWNLGELPGVSLHEWGHSWDDLDGSGGTSPPLETRADWSAAIMLHDSCCGRGAGFSGCGYGDDCTNCDGVRDNDYWYHTSQTPWTATNHGTFWGPCSGGSYYGPCGGEDHCEAGISSQALWDMVKGDNPGSEPDGDFFTECGLDLASGWQLNDLLFWTSHAQLGDMYNCTSWVSTGCSGNTLYELFMSIDDDGDGTANGTPHAAGIFAALDRHEIACGASTDPENQNHTNVECPDLAEPQNFSGYGQNNQVVLDWDTVTDADRYDIYRNESGCSAGFTKVGEVSAPTTTFTDTNVVNNITYYFRVQAYAEELPDCTGTFGPISDCVTATPFPCTMPGTPTNLVATAGGDNIINLTWTDGSPAADTFNIYRAVGTCPQTAYALIASGVSSTSYSDDPVSGQVTFAYVVTAVDITGLCETVYSNCDDAITTGTCTEPPTFAGIQSVTNPGNAICTLDLAWNAGTAHCGGPVLYHVYRSTTSGFTPGSGNLIASVYSTSHNDMNSLVTGTTYYYVVRAEDETNGSIETNLVELSGTPYGPGGGTQVIFSDDFETDTGWTIAGTGEWERAAPQGLGGAYGDPDPTAAVSGTYVLGYDLSGSGTYLGDYENSMSAETTVTSPAIDCTGVTSTQVSFQRWLGVESSSYDHARLYASNDGTNWTTVWSNGSTMSDGAWGLQSYDISAVADNQATVYIRFGMGTTDGSMTYCGWNIDDLEVSGWVDSPCTTGSGCPGNPFVDVSPNGPLTLCEGTSQLLTVNLSGGTSPFQYQWTEDGIDISGATNSTYTANFTDTHAYNCKVRGSGC